MRLSAAAFAILVASLAAGTSRADGNVSEASKRADALYTRGVQLREAGKLDEACASFRESEALERSLGALLNIAECDVRTGRFASARRNFLEAAAAARSSNDAVRADYAAKRAADLEARLPRVRLKIPSEVTVSSLTIDGIAIGDAERHTVMPIDPGRHYLEAKAAGDLVSNAFVDIPGEPGVTDVELAFVKVKRPEPAQNRGRTQRVIGIVGTSVGAVAIGASVVLGLVARKEYKDAVAAKCDASGCPRSAEHDFDAAHTKTTLGTIFFIGGAALGVGGVVLYLTAPSAPRTTVSASARGVFLEASW